MTQVLILLIALGVRILLWILEELAGIEGDFHPDSTYYLDAARYLRANEFDDWLVYATNNELYVVIAALLLEFNDSLTTLRIANLFMGSAIPVMCYQLLSFAKCTKRACLLGAGFVLVLPYQVHLSIHALKDIPFLLCVLLAVYCAARYRVFLTLLFVAALTGLRTYLGLILSMVLVVSFLRRTRPILWIWVAIAIGALAFAFEEDNALLVFAHQEKELEGRAFFANVEPWRAKTPGDLFLLVLTSPVRQLFAPSILDARSLTDLGFAIHISLYQLLFVYTANKVLKTRSLLAALPEANPNGMRLLVLCVVAYVVSATFIEVATPALGPLVRYREMSFLLLSIACFVILNFPARTRKRQQ